MRPPSVIRIAVPRTKPPGPPPRLNPAREALKLAARLDNLLAGLPADEPAELAGAALHVLAAMPRRKAIQASILAQSLELDAGHLSRLLSKLELHGMVQRAATAGRRQSAITLTAFGRFTLRRNHQRRETALSVLLDALPQLDRDRLAIAVTKAGDVLAKLGPKPASQKPHG